MIFLSLFLLGFVSLGYQVLLLREIFSIFSDNELTIGIFLACWMIWTGIGSYIGGRLISKIKNLRNNFGLAASLAGIIMPSEIFLLRILRPVFQNTPTEMLGMVPLFAVSFFSVIVVGFVFGAWYVIASKMLLEENDFSDTASLSYSVETFGAVFGGLLTGILFAGYLNPIQAGLLYSVFIFLFLSLFLSKKYFIVLAFVILCLFDARFFEKYSVSYKWLPFEVAESKNSPYGKITVIKSDEDYDFYLNSSRIYSTYLLPSNEEIVHIPMLTAPAPKNVLIIGGGERDIAELLKYPLKKIVYIEPDEIFLKFLKKYRGSGLREVFKDRRVNVSRDDGRFFIAKNNRRDGEKYDCIILDVPPPVTGVSNRYFTLEYFAELNKSLSPDGIVIFPLLSSENYMSDELKILSASIYKTAERIFKHCVVIPGSNNYFICSQRELKILPSIVSGEIKKKGIKITYLTVYQLGYILRKDRIERLSGWISEKKGEAIVNRDLHPVCYLYGLNYWLSHFKKLPFEILPNKNTSIKAFFITGLFCFFLFFLASKSKKIFMPFVMMAAGCFSMVLELLIIFAFQSVYGCIYYKIGLLMAMGLLGLGAGSYWAGRSLKDRHLPEKTIKKVFATGGAFAILLPFLIEFISGLPRYGEILFYVVIFVSCSLAGIIFPLAISSYQKKEIITIGGFYFSDLIGATAGSMAVSIFFIPVLGIPATSVMCGICMFVLTVFIRQ